MQFGSNDGALTVQGRKRRSEGKRLRCQVEQRGAGVITGPPDYEATTMKWIDFVDKHAEGLAVLVIFLTLFMFLPLLIAIGEFVKFMVKP